MARLFVSLYLFITLTLIGLSAGLERVFTVSEDLPTDSIYKSTLYIANKQNLDLQKLATELKLSYQIRLIDDIAWQTSDLASLKEGQVLTFMDPQLGEQLYIKIDNKQLLEISLPQAQSDPQQLFIYSAVFFLCLGALIALWIWPLWRDLSTLQKTVSCVLPDGTIAKNNIGKNSLVAPIANAINDMRTQIHELIQNQRELSGAVAHEFRTPLARLKFALAMQSNTSEESWIEMQNDVNELEQLVQEMLDFARTNVQIPEMNLAEIPIKQLCQQVVERIEKSHLQGIETIVKGDDVNILADGHFIERAISNLLVNGARYANKKLEVSVHQNAKRIEIIIEDDGKGVAENMQEKIFTPFFRPDESRNRTQGGAGLGLAIVKRIIDWHNGECFVTHSKLGGAKFVIQLNNPFG